MPSLPREDGRQVIERPPENYPPQVVYRPHSCCLPLICSVAAYRLQVLRCESGHRRRLMGRSLISHCPHALTPQAPSRTTWRNPSSSPHSASRIPSPSQAVQPRKDGRHSSNPSPERLQPVFASGSPGRSPNSGGYREHVAGRLASMTNLIEDLEGALMDAHEKLDSKNAEVVELKEMLGRAVKMLPLHARVRHSLHPYPPPPSFFCPFLHPKLCRLFRFISSSSTSPPFLLSRPLPTGRDFLPEQVSASWPGRRKVLHTTVGQDSRHIDRGIEMLGYRDGM